ncbi:DUF2878 domain-containing protein [Endozoicomonas sp. SCSIO W0465]|uniref:DUF2878 domain-containing protein n=1 Tax=Endozoicomonas sp. SCSIO W0465 TaxID=2918516 RepID=UPI00207653B5|nr:DUF2878 domain-containing protein [Endozoicomonas sp. SCSIO W0465]USE38293.1 DUF2878 domain-containing protein [Endozoicomonas sp. SCSIO W0465]
MINYLLFQAGWFACVLGGNQIAMATAVIILFIHLLWIGSWHQEKQILALTFLLGCAIDSFLGNMEILQFHTDDGGRILPLWLACLWLIFATTLRHSLDWSRTHKLYGAILGFFGGPLSYLAGSKMSDVTLAQPLWQTLMILAIIWALVIPILQLFSQAWLNKAKN